MKMIKYALLFILCFGIGQYLIRSYYNSNKDKKEAISKKYNQNTLTRISSPLLIDRGKIKADYIEGFINVKNIGEFDLSELEVLGDCSCTSIKFSSKNLQREGVSVVYYKIDLSKDKGWFNKTINLKGSFFPYNRSIRIEGYKL